MISLTPVAVEKVKSVLAEQGDGRGLRIKATESGCSGLQYTMTLDKSPGATDEIIEIDGIRLFIDRQSLVYLSDTNIDYIDSEAGSGFKFENPNTQPACGCGETFEV